jgi:hypothetical protein
MRKIFFDEKNFFSERAKQSNENLERGPGVDAQQYHHFHDVSVLS